jgi:hypothetical protein
VCSSDLVWGDEYKFVGFPGAVVKWMAALQWRNVISRIGSPFFDTPAQKIVPVIRPTAV